MNQILEYSNINNNGKYSGGGNKNTSDKLVKIFALILLLFAIFLIISGATSFLKNKKTETAKPTAKVYTATIEAISDEENEVVNIIVDNKIEISKIIYNWNSNAERTIQGDGTNHIEKTIDLSAGNSTLNIKVIDIKGNETKKSFTFNSENGKDIISPEITLSHQGDKLIITAEDENELAFITYKWNDEQAVEVRVDEDADDKTIIVEEVDILMGENTITVIAVDAANNTKTETKALTGVTKPEIIVNLIGTGDTLEITCKHENGIKEIYYTLNDRPYQYQTPEGENYTEIKFTQALDEGYNRIKLKVTSVDNIPAEFDGECEYYPNGRPEDTENVGTTQDDSETNDTTTEDSERDESSTDASETDNTTIEDFENTNTVETDTTDEESNTTE